MVGLTVCWFCLVWADCFGVDGWFCYVDVLESIKYGMRLLLGVGFVVWVLFCWCVVLCGAFWVGVVVGV